MSSEPGRDSEPSPDGDGSQSESRDVADFSSEDIVPDEIAIDGFPTLDGNFRSPKFVEDDFPTLSESQIENAVQPTPEGSKSSDVDKWLEAWLEDDDESTATEDASVKASDAQPSGGSALPPRSRQERSAPSLDSDSVNSAKDAKDKVETRADIARRAFAKRKAEAAEKAAAAERAAAEKVRTANPADKLDTVGKLDASNPANSTGKTGGASKSDAEGLADARNKAAASKANARNKAEVRNKPDAEGKTDARNKAAAASKADEIETLDVAAMANTATDNIETQDPVGAADRPKSTTPPTVEMPVIQADQPPVSNRVPKESGPVAEAKKRLDAAPPSGMSARQARRAKLKREQQQNQHAARLNDRQRQISNPVMTGDLSLSTRKSAPRRSKHLVSLVGICLVLALTGGLVYAVANRNSTNEAGRTTSAGAADPIADPTVELPVGGTASAGIKELATSTVRILGLNDGQQAECAGSGIIVEANGTILTNAHVVTSGEDCRFSSIGVAVTSDTSDPAELLYVAEVVAVNSELDLAVIRITETLDGSPIPDAFPAATLGNSESVALGDTISILGYPVIGGDTITFTTGAVSGFSSQAGIGNRAFIKTDATISAGNSGGMAVDANGLVVGIPTKARGSESGPAVDCRPVDDTNNDGVVDKADLCVSVGGFLNGLRPINLAKPILSEVDLGFSLAMPVLEADSATATFDIGNVNFEAPRFSLGEKGNVPRRAVETLSSDAEELCLFVNWSGVPNGTKWDGLWYIDGELAREHGSFEQSWTFGESGENFWMCVLAGNEPDNSQEGIRPGLYEVGFFLEGQLVFAEGIEVTRSPVETFDIGWSNETGEDLCGLAVNPKSKSQQVGLNELDPGAVIKPDEGIVMSLPAGTVVVEAYTCDDGEVIAGEYGGIEITQTETFVIGL